MGHRHVWPCVVILLAVTDAHSHAADAVSPAEMKVTAALAKVRYGDVFSARTALDIIEAKLDQKKLMALIDERWRSVPADVTIPANYQVRCKLCWILGLIRSREAADRLRGYIAEDSHGIVLASGLDALSQFPPAKENADLARAIKVKLGDRVTENVSDHGSFGFAIQWTLAQEFDRFLAAYGKAENATKPGKVVVEPATLHCLGFQWPIEGDDNRNCAVAVAYRKKEAEEWKEAMPLLRVENRPHPKEGVYPGNILAGSLFNLSPATSYEVRLSLADPDGGEAERLLAVRTRPVPRDPIGGRTLHVVPGAGGGAGTRADPFKGIAAADSAARPGDILLLGKGVYQGTKTLTRDGTPAMPIVWRGVSTDDVVIDGSGAFAALMANGRKHVHIEQMSVTNARTHISCRGTEGVVVRQCKIVGVKGRTVVGISINGNSLNCTVSDNSVMGGLPWVPYSGDAGFIAGIAIVGRGHVVAHNFISDWHDGISTHGNWSQYATGALDIYGNDIFQCRDDAIEADYVRQNTRIYRNRTTNSLTGVSCQPVFGGPTYVLYNSFFNARHSGFKLNSQPKIPSRPSGMIIAHNTAVGQSINGGTWRNAVLRNNLFINNSPYGLETYGMLGDFDYNGYASTSTDWIVSLNRIMYSTLDEFRTVTGLEENGRRVTLDIFRKAAFPPRSKTPYGAPPRPWPTPKTYDLRLKGKSAAVDAGVVLPNINNGFHGAAPDLGCYESGTETPHYGPRQECLATTGSAAIGIDQFTKSVAARCVNISPGRDTPNCLPPRGGDPRRWVLPCSD